MLNKVYIPEIDFYFSKFWKGSHAIDLYDVKLPELEYRIEDHSYLFNKYSNNSFIKMLFDESYDSSVYTYLFDQIGFKDLSYNVLPRIRYSPNLIIPMASNDLSGYDLYRIGDDYNLYYPYFENYKDDGLSVERKYLLDKLLYYRNNNTVELNEIDYNMLECGLSKLIYVYLDFVYNGNFKNLTDNSNRFSDSSNLLECLYELFVLNKFHNVISSQTIFLDSSSTIELKPVVKHITYQIRDFSSHYDTTTYEFVDNFDNIYPSGIINIEYPVYSTDSLFVYVNGYPSEINSINYDNSSINYSVKQDIDLSSYKSSTLSIMVEYLSKNQTFNGDVS